MKSFALVFVGLLVVAAGAEWIDIDWSKVRPIEDFDHYWDRLPAELRIYRNVRPSHRVTNGQEATPGQFPYQIALLSNFTGGTGLCGGSVLTNNFILTAGHCVVGAGGILAIGGTAIIGAHNRNVQEATQQRIPFSGPGVFPHPQYDSTNIRNDVAVVRLDSSITFNANVQPTRLPARSDTRLFGGITGTVSGFGRMSDVNQTTSDVVMFTNNPVLTNQDCIAQWNAVLIESQNVCLSGEGNRSACNGDSGGPLVVQDGGNLQIGIVSFGSAAGCAIGMPSVYARVSFFLDFIETNSDYVAGA